MGKLKHVLGDETLELEISFTQDVLPICRFVGHCLYESSLSTIRTLFEEVYCFVYWEVSESTRTSVPLDSTPSLEDLWGEDDIRFVEELEEELVVHGRRTTPRRTPRVRIGTSCLRLGA
jgi:hypothetical protein